ncbi:hypothetical protein Mucpa_6307 [Mucilaginibacter paludis DSM 18603]|uniref:Uncharacterized protein n=1 Tax=Mucilaginibacter paludis DSM 18603 TaxID=714943 RepID=H1Y5U1_9SPHI|nr:hypothetical protein Mucpa_6307 [Mucilaginibacter paludis DSM 18603]
MYWDYKMPPSYKTVHEQCYLITICFDQMLVLNSPVQEGKPINSIKDFLMKIGESLQKQ